MLKEVQNLKTVHFAQVVIIVIHQDLLLQLSALKVITVQLEASFQNHAQKELSQRNWVWLTQRVALLVQLATTVLSKDSHLQQDYVTKDIIASKGLEDLSQLTK